MTFKKLFPPAVVILLLCAGLNSSNAQLLNISVKGGYNLADISGSYPFETRMKSGFSFYISKDIINLPVIKLVGEAGYTQKGFTQDFIITNKFGDETGREKMYSKLGYIDLSVLGKAGIPGGVFFPYVLAGPSFGIKVSNKFYADREELSNFPFMIQMLENFKTTSFGFKFGLGVEIGWPVVSIIAEGRFNHDITVANNDSLFEKQFDIRNKVYEFIVGVKF